MIRLMPFFKILALAYLYSLVNDGGGVKVQINHKSFMLRGRINERLRIKWRKILKRLLIKA